MKFVVNRDLFARSLSRIQGVLNRKATLPVLSNALLEASPSGTLRVAATDLDVTFDGRIPARVEAPGRVTVDGKRLFEIARSLPGEEVAIAVTPELQVQIRCKNAEFVLLGQGAETYPSLPSAEGVEMTPVDGTALRELIDRTGFSASTDESRPNLNGVFFQCLGEGRVRMVSTDGHRLSQGERDARRGADIPARDGVIIPRKGIGELKRLLDEVGSDVSFGFLENNLVMAADDLRLFVRLIDAAFPDYRVVIPKSTQRNLTIDRLMLQSTLRRIAILASERTHGVRMELDGDKMILTSDNPDLGKAREEIPLEGYSGGNLSIAFNSKYVVEILGVLSGEQVDVALNEAITPGLFREHGNPDYLFVVMPMRL